MTVKLSINYLLSSESSFHHLEHRMLSLVVTHQDLSGGKCPSLHDPNESSTHVVHDSNVPDINQKTQTKSSRFCVVEGCTKRAKRLRRCWKHGGYSSCTAEGCTNRAKSKGLCWNHGGGIKCSLGTCTKIAISNGFCWSHGGGKRCHINGCFRAAYERTNHLCRSHYQAQMERLQDSDEPRA